MPHSKIFQDESVQIMFKSILPEHEELQILYQATQDSFKAKSFHSKCDN